MSLVLDALEGRRNFIAFGDLVDMVRESPNNASRWVALIEKLRTQAATGNSHNYSKRWHQEAWEVCKKALESNPNNIDLKRYINAYKQFLEMFDYSPQ
jgi:hypothetical protein